MGVVADSIRADRVKFTSCCRAGEVLVGVDGNDAFDADDKKLLRETMDEPMVSAQATVRIFTRLGYVFNKGTVIRHREICCNGGPT